jgi:hypothetical protein
MQALTCIHSAYNNSLFTTNFLHDLLTSNCFIEGMRWCAHAPLVIKHS